MRFIAFMLLMLTLPCAATAQGYSTAPIIVDLSKSAAPAKPPAGTDFPEWAVTQAGQKTSGQRDETPATPATPAAPAAASAVANPVNPANPNAPIAPKSPISKLWPRDTVPIFVQSCVGFHVELIPACTCVITELMLQMPHDEFLALSADESIERDPRLLRIRQGCVATPQRRAE